MTALKRTSERDRLEHSTFELSTTKELKEEEGIY